MSTERFWILIWVVIFTGVVLGIGVGVSYSNKQDKQFIDAGFTKKPLCRSWTYEWVKE